MNATAVLVAVGLAIGSAPAPAPAKWRALLEPIGNASVRGGATAEAVGDNRTHFIISIRNGTPNTTLSWHMHTGTCAAPGGVEGSGYPILQVGPGGIAQAAATLEVTPPATGRHIIQVHSGGTAVACGDLRPVE
jgi:hypothetical protein